MCRTWKLSRGRLCDLIRSLQCDAFQLADRVEGLRSEWKEKLVAIHLPNGFLRVRNHPFEPLVYLDCTLYL